MAKTKLSKIDLTELNKRLELINQHILTVQALDFQKGMWLIEKIKKLGLDPNINHDVDLKTGEIRDRIEVKQAESKIEPKVESKVESKEEPIEAKKDESIGDKTNA